MDKPKSLSVKDYLIRVLAVKMLTSEKIIEAVVDHQYQSANEAMATNHSVEISGFGKMLFNKKKAVRKMEKLCSKEALFIKMLLDDSITKQRKESLTLKLHNTRLTIDALKPRINED